MSNRRKWCLLFQSEYLLDSCSPWVTSVGHGSVSVVCTLRPLTHSANAPQCPWGSGTVGSRSREGSIPLDGGVGQTSVSLTYRSLHLRSKPPPPLSLSGVFFWWQDMMGVGKMRKIRNTFRFFLFNLSICFCVS